MLSGTVCRSMTMVHPEHRLKVEKCNNCGTEYPLRQYTCMAGNVTSAEVEPLKSICKSTQWQQQNQWGERTVHKISQEDDLWQSGPVEQDGMLDMVMLKYINLYNVKSIIFTQLVFSTSWRGTHDIYKVDSESNGNLIPFRIFKPLFPRSKIEAL